MSENKTNKKSLAKRISGFFTETKSELAKATWPSKSQLIRNTAVILVFIAVVAIILAVLDLGFSQLFRVITNLL